MHTPMQRLKYLEDKLGQVGEILFKLINEQNSSRPRPQEVRKLKALLRRLDNLVWMAMGYIQGAEDAKAGRG
jgi:hypothetical protein